MKIRESIKEIKPFAPVVCIILCTLFLAGCAGGNRAGGMAGSGAAVDAQGEDTVSLIDKASYHLGRIDVITESLLDFETNTASGASLNKAMEKVSGFEKEANEMEDVLGRLEAREFDGKDDFMRIFREITRLSGEMVEKTGEYYSFHLDMKRQEALQQEKDRLEELHASIINCRCRSVDCEAHMESSLEFLGGSADIFSEINEKYGLESFGDAAEMWKGQKAVAEEHWPGLIERSARLGKKCYQLNDDYGEYVAALDEVDEISEAAMEDELAGKWIIPIDELADKMGNLVVEIEQAEESLEG